MVVEPPRRLGMLRRRRRANLFRFGGGGGWFGLVAVLFSSGLSCGDGLEEARGRFGLEPEVTVLASDDPRDKKRPIGLIGEVGLGVEVGLGLGLGLRGSEGDVEIDGGREAACEARESAEGWKRECVRFGETVKKRECANGRCCTHFPLPILGAQVRRINIL